MWLRRTAKVELLTFLFTAALVSFLRLEVRL